MQRCCGMVFSAKEKAYRSISVYHQGKRVNMKSKEDVKTMIDQAPASRAYNRSHSAVANTAAGRIYALVLIFPVLPAA